MKFSDKLKAERKRAGFTQKELGQRLGVSSAMIAQYENDLRNPKYETIEKMAIALNCDISELLTSREESTMITEQVLNYLSSEPIEKRIANSLRFLNDEGKRVAAERVQELSEIPRYRSDRHEP